MRVAMEVGGGRRERGDGGHIAACGDGIVLYLITVVTTQIYVGDTMANSYTHTHTEKSM